MSNTYHDFWTDFTHLRAEEEKLGDTGTSSDISLLPQNNPPVPQSYSEPRPFHATLGVRDESSDFSHLFSSPALVGNYTDGYSTYPYGSQFSQNGENQTLFLRQSWAQNPTTFPPEELPRIPASEYGIQNSPTMVDVANSIGSLGLEDTNPNRHNRKITPVPIQRCGGDITPVPIQGCIGDNNQSVANPRPFRCRARNCNAIFKRRSELERHRDSVHQTSSGFLCPVKGCNRSEEGNGFSRKDNLRQHLRLKHDQRFPKGRGSREQIPGSGSE